MNKKRLLAPLLIGAMLGLGYLGYQRYQAAQAEDGQGLIAYGNVDIRQVDLGFRVGGRVNQLLVDEGDTVKAGQLLATLDDLPFQQELTLSNTELSAANATLSQLETGYRPQEIKVTEATVAEREVVLANLQIELARRESLLQQGSVTQQSYDDVKAKRDEAQARLKSAREQLALMQEGYRQEEIDKARAQVESAKVQQQIAMRRVDDTLLHAPSDGTVLTRALEPGAMALNGQTILTLSVDQPAWIRAYIAEPDLGKIHPGMAAEVFSDSNPDKPYHGQIGFIAAKAEFTPKNVETTDLRTQLVYRFRVVVEDANSGLRQGMPVTVVLGSPTAAAQRR